MINYYEVLEISKNASHDVIRAAYQALLHRYNLEHDSEDQTEAQKLNYLHLAYDVLSDPDKRRTYNEEYGRNPSFQHEITLQHKSSEHAEKNVDVNNQTNSNEVMVLFKNKAKVSSSSPILSRLKWNKWGWSVSILAVAAVLISMVQPDTDKALRGQLAVQSQAKKKNKKTEVEKTAAENQHTDSVENKVTEEKPK